jgi:protein-tyrosine phosphatase
MIRCAWASGTTDIVATPHANIAYKYDADLVDSRIRSLRESLEGKIRIHRGCDFHLSLKNIQEAVQDPARFSVNGLGYLLIEFPDMAPLQGIDNIFRILQNAGLTPIVTHPERNAYLASDFGRLARWVNRGIYLQLTAQSFTDELFGPATMQWCTDAFKRGLVHFVASDAHDIRVRTARLDKAKTYLQKHFGEDYAELLLESHPRAVIEGNPLPGGPVAPKGRKGRKWFQCWS